MNDRKEAKYKSGIKLSCLSLGVCGKGSTGPSGGGMAEGQARRILSVTLK